MLKQALYFSHDSRLSFEAEKIINARILGVFEKEKKVHSSCKDCNKIGCDTILSESLSSL